MKTGIMLGTVITTVGLSLGSGSAFAGTWHWDVTGKQLTDGNWTLNCSQPYTENGVTGIQVTKFVSGSGVLDLTNFKADTAGDAAAAGKPNYDVIALKDSISSSTMTEFIAPAVIRCDGSVFTSAALLERIVLSPDIHFLGAKFCNNAKALREFQPMDMPELENLGSTAFGGCSSLKGDFSVAKILELSSNVFRASAITSLSAPLAETVTAGAFGSCSSLTNLYLPRLRNITGFSISDNTGVRTLSIDGASITNLGEKALYGMKAPLPTDWPNLENLGRDAFSLSSISGDVSTPKVPVLDRAFYQCPNLTSIYAPSCRLYGNNTFYASPALTNVTVEGSECFPAKMPSGSDIGTPFYNQKNVPSDLKTLNWIGKIAPSTLPRYALSSWAPLKNGSPVIVRAKITDANRAQWEAYCTTLAADFTDLHRRIANYEEIKDHVVGFIGTVADKSGDLVFTAAANDNLCWIVELKEQVEGELVTIAGLPDNYGEPVPGYGVCSNVVVGEDAEFDCPTYARGATGGIVVGCDGWKLVPEKGEELSGMGTNAVFTYEERLREAEFFWQWSDRFYRTKVSLPEGQAELAYDPAPDYTNEVGDLFYVPGRQVRITATAADSTFVWSCEGAGCTAEGNVLMLTTGAEEIKVTCAVRGRWHWDVEGKKISNGNWTINCSWPETVGESTGILLTSVVSGSGGIDLTTFKEDTAGDASAAGKPNYDIVAVREYFSSTAMTEFIAPAVLKCGTCSFEQASSLKRVVLSPDVRVLNVKFCNSAKALEEFQPTDMPELETFGGSAFGGCSSLKGDFTMGKALTFGSNAFRGSGITSLSAPLAETVTEGAFVGCNSLTNLYLPRLRNITGASIGDHTDVRTLTIDGASITNLGDNALNGVKASLPTDWPNLENLGVGGFMDSALAGDVSMPKVPVLDNAFNGCKQLTSVFAPKCDLYGHTAFSGCTALTNVTVRGGACFPSVMPGTGKSSADSFNGATSLAALTWLGKTAPSSLPAQAFSSKTLANNGSAVIVRAKITPENRAQWESYCTTLAADLTDTHRKIANWDKVKNSVIGFVGTVSESGSDLVFTAANDNICWIVDGTRIGTLILIR